MSKNRSDQLAKLEKVEQFLKEGLGRRRIAKILGISEWEARVLVNAVAPVKDTLEPEKESTPINITDLLVEPTVTNPNTDIRLTINSQIDDIPSAVNITGITKKVACVSDIHYPYHDDKSENIALSFLSDWKPDVLVWNGDIFDFYSVSQYVKDSSKKMNIQQEIDCGYARMKTWVKTLSNTKHYFICGNHEDRLTRLIKNQANALSALRSLKIDSNIDFQKLGITFVPVHKDLEIGSLTFIHGTSVRKGAGNSAKAHYDQYGCSIIMGHCHRLGITYKRTKMGTFTMIENGTLCDFDVEYTRFPDWQQGFTTMEFDGSDFQATSRPIVNHKLVANGRVYKS